MQPVSPQEAGSHHSQQNQRSCSRPLPALVAKLVVASAPTEGHRQLPPHGAADTADQRSEGHDTLWSAQAVSASLAPSLRPHSSPSAPGPKA